MGDGGKNSQKYVPAGQWIPACAGMTRARLWVMGVVGFVFLCYKECKKTPAGRTKAGVSSVL